MSIIKISRRDFVRISSATTAGLVLGVAWADTKKRPAGETPKTTSLGAFVEIGADGIVTIWVPKSDMGQDVRTALPMLVAEELGADWKAIRVKQAFFDKKFGNMGTGGSSSIRTLWKPLRQAGAAAREMLVAAAARRLAVDPATLTVRDGVIADPAGGGTLSFADVAADAAKLEPPKEPKLKDPSQFRLIGKATPRRDNKDIATGKATYGIDVRMPGMLYAAVKRSPVFGGKVAGFDAAQAKAIPGVKHVVKIDSIGVDLPWSGVAVIATNTWAAMRGRDALDVKWDSGAGAGESSDGYRKEMAEAVSKPGRQVINSGDTAASLANAEKKVDATYELPFLAHATMEPMNATADVRADGAELWVPTQFASWVNGSVSKALNLAPEKVKVNVTLLGGGFGRRANADFALEAALLSKAAGAPVKVQWTREDDMTHDFYRPMSHHRVEGAVDGEGKITAWLHRFAATPIGTYISVFSDPNKPEDSEIGGIDDLPYAIPNFRVEFTPVASVVPRGWWRSVEHSINGFVINSFVDELAHAAGRDPIAFHLANIPAGKRVASEGPAGQWPFESDRLRRVIELVRDKSGWGTPLPPGRGRGFAVQYSFHSYCAQVAEVTVTEGKARVDRIVCAIDCGTAVNPDGIRAQIEGGIVYGLGAALHEAITVEGGAVKESNFDSFPLITMAEMPKVEVHIVPSVAAPTGAGEPGLPPTAPAVANAIFAATAKRIRRLPLV
jgi:isoquinoline 1-oxidoreductase beta subunit